MSTPELLLIVPIIASVATYLLRRWRLAAVMTGVVALAILFIVVAVTNVELQSIDQSNGTFLRSSWLILGRSLQLNIYSRIVMLIVYGIMGLLFLISLVLLQASLFLPLSLLVMAPLAGTLMADSTSTGSAFLLTSGAVLAILIQGERAGSTLSSFRYLSLTVLAFPILLTISWMLDTTPAQFLTWTPFLLLLTFLILLLSFPFQVWVSPTVSESKSLVTVIVFGLAYLVIMYFCFGLIVDNPIAYGNAQLLQILRASGAVTLIIASALIVTAPSISRLIGYLLLIDIGSTAIAMGLGGRIGLELVSFLVLSRIAGLLMVGFGLGMIRRHTSASGGDKYQSFHVQKLARRSPLGLTLIIFGGLSLAGFPLTPGFAGRWTLVSLTNDQYQWISVIIALAVASATIGMVRMFAPKPSADGEDNDQATVTVESKAMRITASLVLALGVLITLLSPLLLSLSTDLISVL